LQSSLLSHGVEKCMPKYCGHLPTHTHTHESLLCDQTLCSTVCKMNRNVTFKLFIQRCISFERCPTFVTDDSVRRVWNMFTIIHTVLHMLRSEVLDFHTWTRICDFKWNLSYVNNAFIITLLNNNICHFLVSSCEHPYRVLNVDDGAYNHFFCLYVSFTPPPHPHRYRAIPYIHHTFCFLLHSVSLRWSPSHASGNKNSRTSSLSVCNSFLRPTVPYVWTTFPCVVWTRCPTRWCLWTSIFRFSYIFCCDGSVCSR
jgi:hypothetical protein